MFERRGTAGLVTLNRPQALNAVSHAMVRALARRLAEWEDDPAVTRVVVTAAGGRAFSAGGDLRGALRSRPCRASSGGARLFPRRVPAQRADQALSASLMSRLIDGIVMGGGVGVSVHGSHRVAGDRFVFAMPEVGIGFFPDIGATWFLPRLPGALGDLLRADRRAARRRPMASPRAWRPIGSRPRASPS